MPSAYTMMALAAGRLVSNGDILFAGTGLSMLAATVAKRVHALQATVFFETSGIDPRLDELPLTVADPRVMSGSCLNSGLLEALAILAHRRLRTISFLGAAQIDAYGNINSTCLGDYHRPRVRFPGSGGAGPWPWSPTWGLCASTSRLSACTSPSFTLGSRWSRWPRTPV